MPCARCLPPGRRCPGVEATQVINTSKVQIAGSTSLQRVENADFLQQDRGNCVQKYAQVLTNTCNTRLQGTILARSVHHVL